MWCPQVLAAAWQALGAGLSADLSTNPALKREADAAAGTGAGPDGARMSTFKRVRTLFKAADGGDANLMGPGRGGAGQPQPDPGGNPTRASDAQHSAAAGSCTMEGTVAGLGPQPGPALRPLLLPMLHRRMDTLGPCYARFVRLLDSC